MRNATRKLRIRIGTVIRSRYTSGDPPTNWLDRIMSPAVQSLFREDTLSLNHIEGNGEVYVIYQTRQRTDITGTLA